MRPEQTRTTVPPVVQSATAQLSIVAGPEFVAASVLRTTHTNRGWRGTPSLVSLRYIPRAEWDTDPVGCLREELASLVALQTPDV